ncbi:MULTISPECIES: hypothetical protein [Pseudoalteromonas]|uniref:hypothetical protein n=1 Tax=Pseudoalteromonas TaxID=53246 RepID=UPI00029ADADC|nr:MULTISPECIES: hypothetical protein [Pseudoalteromonas]MBR8845213.1 hypothetical protein [Pseudoalteromonas sp. JC3]QUI71730.1 hypothetical protein GSF13_19190 [Pseudoalteromonas sp. M8]WJE07913.1 hypothetical protein QSH61_13595 [Pseudoalteromonas sp. JC3]
MKLSNLVLLSTATIAFFYIQLWDPRIVMPLYLSLLVVSTVYGFYAKNINVLHISSFILICTGISYVIFEGGIISYVLPDENKLLQGTVVYGTQLLLSVIAFIVMIFRVQLSRLISKSNDIELTYFDGLFHWIYMYTSLIYLLGLVENIAWSYFNLKSWTFIYDNFEGLIYIAWAICCGAVLTMMICSAKSNDSQEPRLS